MLRKILKISGWFVGSVVGLVLVAYLILIAINWRDAPPSAEAVRLQELYRNRPAVADEDNAFVYLTGFEVPPGEDPHDMGVKRIAWMRASMQARSWDEAADPLGEPYHRRNERSAGIKQFLEACTPGNVACTDAFLAGADVLEEWMASESWLFERYRRLIAQAGWRESVPLVPEAPIPRFATIMEGQKLLLLQARALIAKGDHARARELLESDLRFWRMTLESSDLLITKMMALAGVRNHFRLGNLVLRDARPGTAANALPVGWRTPISDAERSMLRCLTGEYLWASELTTQTIADGDFGQEEKTLLIRSANAVLLPLFQPQDLLNRYAAQYLHIAESLSVPLDRYDEAVDQLTHEAEIARDELLRPRSAYNIVGTILRAISGGPDYSSYAARVGDIEGVRRAALLAVTLRDANVKAQDVAAVLQDAELREPYDGQPFTWDEQGGAIVFRGLQAGEHGEHRIYY